MRRMFVAAMVFGLVAVSAGTAAATQPDDVGPEKWVEYGEEVLEGMCEFPIVETNEAHWMITPSGVLILHGFYTLTNPISGTSYDGNWTESWKMFGDVIQGNGLLWKLTIPGFGLVLIDAGYRLYSGPPDYELLIVRGPSSFMIEGGLDEFCEVMS